MILDKVMPPAARLLLVGAFALAAIACGRQTAPESVGTTPLASAGRSKIKVAATISTLAGLVEAVGGDNVDVFSIVPVGVSPETYDPAPQDLVKVARAQLIIENGAGLELWLQKLLTSAANSQARVLVLSDGMPMVGAGVEGSVNPHLWLDPLYAQQYVRKIAAALREIDSAHAAAYSENERAEIAKLATLDRWIRSQIAIIPPDQRAMITFHDAWLYFDRRYGLRDIGAIERSPGQQPSAAGLAALIKQARDNHVHAIFAEPQFSPKLAAQLAASAGITTVSDLYDDTLGTTPQLQTYEGMMRYDVDTIVKALRT